MRLFYYLSGNGNNFQKWSQEHIPEISVSYGARGICPNTETDTHVLVFRDETKSWTQDI